MVRDSPVLSDIEREEIVTALRYYSEFVRHSGCVLWAKHLLQLAKRFDKECL